MKSILLFLVVFLTVFVGQSANLADSLAGRLGLDANYLSVGVISLVSAALVMRRHKAIAASAVSLMILASLPPAMTGNLVDRDILYALFIAVLAAPYVADLFE